MTLTTLESIPLFVLFAAAIWFFLRSLYYQVRVHNHIKPGRRFMTYFWLDFWFFSRARRNVEPEGIAYLDKAKKALQLFVAMFPLAFVYFGLLSLIKG